MISTFYKVLPTDPRFRDLNLAQKFILSSAIDMERAEKYDLIESVLTGVKAYLNPDMCKMELAEEGIGSSEDDYVKINTEFAHQQATGRATGIPESSDMMKEAIAEFYEELEKEKRVMKIVGIGEPEDDESVLGD